MSSECRSEDLCARWQRFEERFFNLVKATFEIRGKRLFSLRVFSVREELSELDRTRKGHFSIHEPSSATKHQQCTPLRGGPLLKRLQDFSNGRAKILELRGKRSHRGLDSLSELGDPRSNLFERCGDLRPDCAHPFQQSVASELQHNFRRQLGSPLCRRLGVGDDWLADRFGSIFDPMPQILETQCVGVTAGVVIAEMAGSG